MNPLHPTSRKPQSSQIAETLLSLTRSLPAPASKPSAHLLQSSTDSAAVSAPISPAEKSLPLRSTATNHGNRHQIEASDSDGDEPAPQPDISLARSLELLIGKLTAYSEAPKSKSAIKPRVPDIFDGTDTSLLNNFIFQSSMYISARSNDFPDDESRVTFVLSYLSGTPLDWFQTELSHAISDVGDLPLWFRSYPEFISELRRLFGPQDPATDAMDALEGLRYRNSTKAARYTVTFNQHASRTGWNDQALTRQYYKGLPDRLKDDIARIGKPAKLRALQSLVTTLDQRYWERQSELGRDQQTSPEHSPSTSSLPSRSESPAEKISRKFTENSSEIRLDTPITRSSHLPSDTNDPKPQTPSEAPSTSFAQRIADLLGPDGKLKPEERQRRMDNGLCLRCGEPGHMVADCPRNLMPGLRGRSVSATPSSDSGSISELESQ
jgi:hypothetical protein